MTNTTIALLILAVHLICGLIAVGFNFSYCQEEYPITAKENYKSYQRFCWTFGMLYGFFALVATIVAGNAKHGWRLW